MSISGLSSEGRDYSSNLARQRRGQRSFDLTRVLDVVIAASAGLLILPLLAVLALVIHLQDRGPAVFAQTRIGRDGRPFRCLKFRSMVVDADKRLSDLLASDPRARAEWAATQKLRNDPRVTRLGAFLRKSSLDELPQIINVLRGEMSIVGPRPIVPSEIARYGRAYRDYCTVRPGITGLWQISGRNDVSYQRRVALDKLYVQAKCLRVDIAIVLKTVVVVLTRKGSY
jgi:exopolysaccharide production protein ExoY